MPGAGGAYRLWPAARYAEVARALAARGCYVVLLGAADAVAAAAQIAACAPGACLDLTGTTTLARTAAVLSRARLSLSADTGVLHLAYAVGTATVALFGPGLHRKWAPPSRRHRVVRLGLPCSPCTVAGRVPPCPIGIACMRDLGVAPVLAAAEELLQTESR
jgi:ADP-heptose:LPS heptosyltransferase